MIVACNRRMLPNCDVACYRRMFITMIVACNGRILRYCDVACYCDGFYRTTTVWYPQWKGTTFLSTFVTWWYENIPWWGDEKMLYRHTVMTRCENVAPSYGDEDMRKCCTVIRWWGDDKMLHRHTVMIWENVVNSYGDEEMRKCCTVIRWWGDERML